MDGSEAIFSGAEEARVVGGLGTVIGICEVEVLVGVVLRQERLALFFFIFGVHVKETACGVHQNSCENK